MNTASKLPYKAALPFLVVLPFAAAIACLGMGRFYLSAFETAEILWRGIFFGRDAVENALGYSVIFNIRLPRIILAVLIGAGLSVAGAAFQAMFSNPLATADTLGVTAGASLGACIALLFRFNLIGVQLMALAFGLAAMLLITFLGRKNGKTNIIMMILGGIIMASMFSAFLSLVRYVADPEDILPTITFWLMGSLANASYQNLLLGAPFIIVGTVVLYLLRWKLNILSLNEEEAQTLGVNVQAMRLVVIICATSIAASSVSMAGQVGWVGLLIPLICRMLFGSNNQRIVPACISIGAVFMLVIDTVARAATAAEIPITILTATIGAPIFIVLLRRTGGVWL